MRKVIVYSAEWCLYCHMIQDFLKEHKIEFETKDVDKRENAIECMEKSGQSGIPVTLIGDEVVVGFNEARLKELLKIK